MAELRFERNRRVPILRGLLLVLTATLLWAAPEGTAGERVDPRAGKASLPAPSQAKLPASAATPRPTGSASSSTESGKPQTLPPPARKVPADAPSRFPSDI